MRYMHLAQKISELAVRKAEEEEAKQYAQRYTCNVLHFSIMHNN